MFNTPKDQLFTLIRSLTKSEKRNFKLYANRINAASESKFLQLFDVLDKQTTYDEEVLLKKMPHIKKRHLANLKRHLYKQILTSLRLVFIKKKADIHIREQLDFARILYGKGIYMQSLRILERIKKIAWDNHQDILHLEILEFQKMIETRHVTQSRQTGKIEHLLQEATRRSFVTYATSIFSNLNIQVHGWYIQNGHVKTEVATKELKDFYKAQCPPESFPTDRMTFHEKINLYQANYWLNYALLNFRKARESALEWLNQFETEHDLKEHDPDLFMRAYYYLLVAFFMEGNLNEYQYYLEKFQSFVESQKYSFNENSNMIAFVYLELSKLNWAFMQDDFSGVIAQESSTYEAIKRFQDQLDPHRVLLFYYKFAYAQFRQGDFTICLDTLNNIVHHSDIFLRNDLLFASRFLHILCHYELGNYDVAEHLNKSCRRSFAQRTKQDPFKLKMLKLIGELLGNPANERNQVLRTFSETEAELIKAKTEQRTMKFFDLSAWIQSHLGETATFPK